MSRGLVDDRTYYVTIRVEGAEAPVWRSPWLTREQAATLLSQKREEVRQARWTHRVQAFYRDGSIAKLEVAS